MDGYNVEHFQDTHVIHLEECIQVHKANDVDIER